MGTNDERILSKKYFKISDEYYQAGFNTKNLSNRYKFWNLARIYKNVAINIQIIERLTNEGGKNV